MIFGNPCDFAIYIDVVEEWSFPDSPEGMFAYIIKGEFLPLNITERSCTLGCYIVDLYRTIEWHKKTSVENAEYFHLPPDIAYPKLDAMAHFPFENNYSDSCDEDNTYDITVGEMLSDTKEIFLVSNLNLEKIIYYSEQEKKPKEVVIKKGKVDKVMSDVITWYEKNISAVRIL